jgi:hypothetical protein
VTGVPVGEGFVVLLDERDREVARSLTSTDGRFLLRAPAPGTYRLRSERIGYVAFVSPPIALAQGQTVTHRLVITAVGVELTPVVIAGRSRCRTRPDREQATSAVWEEVRKALAAAVWMASHPAYRFRAVAYRRVWDAGRVRAALEITDTLDGYWRAPWASRPAAELAEHGYIVAERDSTAYYGPDAQVLQNDAFLASHCFKLVRRRSAGQEQVGLSFEPEPGRRLPDVRGVLWLDARTAELRTLEFSYTDVPEGVEDERVGGTIVFLRLPSGAWIVQRWEIRMPRIGLETFTPPGGRPERRVRLLGFRDGGGEVLEIRTADGTVVYPP